MPIYEYKCPGCGHLFEVLRKISDSPDGKCPRCQKQAKRVFHPVGVIFKGSGFYTTDYKNKSSLPKADGKEQGPDGPASSEGASSESASDKKETAAPSETKKPAAKDKGKKEA